MEQSAPITVENKNGRKRIQFRVTRTGQGVVIIKRGMGENLRNRIYVLI